MLLFCPTCGNLLLVEESAICLRFSCSTCPYICNIKRKISTRIYPKLKVCTPTELLNEFPLNDQFKILQEVDHVMGGAAAWENVDSTDAACPSCSNDRAYFMQIQIRSADEPMTTFYKCCKCGHNWRD